MSKTLLTLFLFFLPTQLGRHFWPKESFVFGLKIDYLSPTFYLQDIFVLLLISVWFISKRKYFLGKKIFFPIIIYFLFSSFNIYFSLVPLLSFFAWLRISEFILLAIIIAKEDLLVWRILQKALPLILIFEFCLGFYQTFCGFSFGGPLWFLGERTFSILTPQIARGIWLGEVFLRPYGTFSHPNSLAGFTLVSLVLIIGKKSLRIADKLSIVFGFCLIILCFSRNVWLATLILGGSFIIKKTILEKNKKLCLNFICFFSFTVTLVIFFLFLKSSVESSSFENRKQLADQAIFIIQKQPFLGIGANNFIVGLAKQKTVWNWLYWLQPAHNIFLLTASETGLIGLFLFLGFLTLTQKKLFPCFIVQTIKKQSNNKKNFQSSLFIALFVILFTGLFDHYWLTLIQNQLLFVTVLGLSWGAEKCQENDKMVQSKNILKSKHG